MNVFRFAHRFLRVNGSSAASWYSRHAWFRACVVALTLVVAFGSATAQVPTDGLVGYWKGNHNALDSSPTHNDGAFAGSYVDGGPFGHAAFDLSTGQTAGHVRMLTSAAYDFQHFHGWTVGFWFNTNHEALGERSQTFLGQDDGPGYQPKWFIG